MSYVKHIKIVHSKKHKDEEEWREKSNWINSRLHNHKWSTALGVYFIKISSIYRKIHFVYKNIDWIKFILAIY